MLESIKLPSSLEIITTWSYKKTKITNITITENIKVIEVAAFLDCTELSLIICESPHFVLHNGILYSKDYKTLLMYPANTTSEILPSVRHIDGCKGFSGCSLESFVLKIPLISTGGYLFRRSYNLVSVDLTCGKMTYLNYSDFGWCPLLKEVLLPDTIEVMERSVFLGAGQLTAIKLPSKLINGNNCFDNSIITDVFYCGINVVEGTISTKKINIHVTQNYPGTVFMGKQITDKNSNCEGSKCQLLLPNALFCPTMNQCHYFSYIPSLISPMIIIFLID